VGGLLPYLTKAFTAVRERAPFGTLKVTSFHLWNQRVRADEGLHSAAFLPIITTIIRLAAKPKETHVAD
jgi:hypothetical protein